MLSFCVTQTSKSMAVDDASVQGIYKLSHSSVIVWTTVRLNCTTCVFKGILIEVLGLKILETCLSQGPRHMLDSRYINQPTRWWRRMLIKSRFTILEKNPPTYPRNCLAPLTYMRTVIAKWVYLAVLKLSNSCCTVRINHGLAQSTNQPTNQHIQESSVPYIVKNGLTTICELKQFFVINIPSQYHHCMIIYLDW
jgi:hypothetical protein